MSLRKLWRKLLEAVIGEELREADLRRALVESLYASPASLAVGAFAGLMLSLTIAGISRDPVMIICTAIISLIAIARTTSAIFYYRKLKSGRGGTYRRWEMAYELGAWVYAGMLGALAFITLIRFEDPAIHILSVALATGYAAGISGRNAGRTKIAVGQTCLALLPTALGLWLDGNIGYRILAIVLIAMVFAMAEITRTTHRIVVEALRGKKEKSLLAAKYERLARYDDLTGVENRMAMQMRLRELFDANDGQQDALGILWMDLDRFKDINDSLGHMVGDALLVTVVERLSELMRGRGHIARFGGDEFVILCPGADRSAALGIAEEVRVCFEQGVDVGVHHLAISASIGVAVGPQDGQDADELMQHADLALYEAKAQGRNRVVSFGWSMKERFHRVHEIERGLRCALAEGQMEVHFQPIFDVKTGRIQICEGLLRWNHPLLGPVSPGEFVPIAESIGMIEPLTQWVLRQACLAAAQWPEHIRVAVNISPASLRYGELPRAILEMLVESGLSARRLELEVTESIFLNDDGQTHQMLRALRQIGLRLVLDDFGTGYSSLSYLRSYRFDGIKIDRSFIRRITESREDQAIVSAVGHLAEALGMEIVAEGIETAEQLNYARDANIHNVQGFLMSKAQPRPVIDEMIARDLTIGDAMASELRHAVARRA